MSSKNPPGAEHGPRLVRPAVAELTRLRLLVALLVLPAALWLLLAVDGTLAKAVGLMGALAALGWLSVALRVRRRPPPCLLLGERGLHLLPCPEKRGGEPPAEPGGEPAVRWREVRAVEVDEEALLLRVHRATGEPLLLRPPWEGVGLHELGEALRRAAARASEDG